MTGSRPEAERRERLLDGHADALRAFGEGSSDAIEYNAVIALHFASLFARPLDPYAPFHCLTPPVNGPLWPALAKLRPWMAESAWATSRGTSD